MSERKKTPDLLGLVMSGSDIQENKEIKQENHKTSEQESVKDLNILSNKDGYPYSNKEIKQSEFSKSLTYDDEPKEKATFNLSKQILTELEDEWINIRKTFGGNKRITKTLLVEVALEMALEDFKNREQNGKFYSKLANNKSVKQ